MASRPPRRDDPAARRPAQPAAPLRLSRDVLAHLRAVAAGVPVLAAATTYLVTDGRAAQAAHQAAVQAAVLIARRARLGPHWRALGLLASPAALPAPEAADAADGAGGADGPPALEAWAASEGLDDWPAEELQALYAERFALPPRAARKARQAERLRRLRLDLLRALEAHVVAPPSPGDPVRDWLSEPLAARLEQAGFRTLGELRQAIALGGRWWRGIPAYGATKAQRLADQVRMLVGTALPADWTRAHVGPDLDGAAGANRGDAALIDAGEDRAAIEAWLRLATQSPQTERAYRREAERFLLWLLVERRRALSDARPQDCRAYMDFLARVPAHWMSRRAATRLAPGWAPFATQPGVASQRHALTVLRTLFARLVKVGYLRANPWEAVNTRLPDDPRGTSVPGSRAFTPAAWAALRAHVPRLRPPAAARMAWLLAFARATGLRATELLLARCGDLFLQDGAHWLHVHGKGARHRQVPVPSSALDATRAYLHGRCGLALEDAHPNTPLLAVLGEPDLAPSGAPGDLDRPALPGAAERAARGYMSYPTLAAAFRRFSAAALAASDLDAAQRAAARHASLHWLRHTHATRAAERNAPPDVLQANLGHADPRTTAGYYRAQQRRQREAMEAAFGNED